MYSYPVEKKRLTLVHIVILVIVLVGGFLAFKAPNTSEKLTNDDNSSGPTTNAVLVSLGEDEYSFSGIDWILQNQGEDFLGVPQTMVRLQFKDFTRNESVIEVLPYRLGVYKGVCRAKDARGAIARAVCDYGGSSHEFRVIHDEGIVTVSSRVVKTDTLSEEEMRPLLHIDLFSVIVE